MEKTLTLSFSCSASRQTTSVSWCRIAAPAGRPWLLPSWPGKEKYLIYTNNIYLNNIAEIQHWFTKQWPWGHKRGGPQHRGRWFLSWSTQVWAPVQGDQITSGHWTGEILDICSQCWGRPSTRSWGSETFIRACNEAVQWSLVSGQTQQDSRRPPPPWSCPRRGCWGCRGRPPRHPFWRR